MASPSTLAPATFETNIEIVLSKKWSDYIEAELEQHKASIEGLNTLLPVAAFIAGVQAQIISFTIALPRSTISRTANVLAFSGLIFDISGTATGVLSTLVLRQKIKEATYLLNLNSLMRQRLKDSCGNKIMQPEPNSKDFSKAFEDFKELMRGRYPSLHNLDFGCNLPVVSQPTKYWSILYKQVDLASSAMTALRKIPDGNQDPYEKILRTPSVLMMFGVELLMISIILLAAKALPREVWITCTVVVAACMCGPLTMFYMERRLEGSTSRYRC